VWQQATAPGTYNWQEALNYAESLTLAGYSDWRLPNKNELLTLVNFERMNPAIDIEAFPDTDADAIGYWSSSTLAWYPSAHWGRLFSNGNYIAIFSTDNGYVRVVRGKQAILGDICIDLTDAVLALKIIAGIEPTQKIYNAADVNGDGIIGIEETIFILEKVARFRTDPSDVDDDGDGYTENEGDCDDSNPNINPGASETCGDGIDQDCNGSDLSCDDFDNDFDGYTENEGDCNDRDKMIHPGATEICGDGIDQDCNGSDVACRFVDNGNGTVTDTRGNVWQKSMPKQDMLHVDAVNYCYFLNLAGATWRLPSVYELRYLFEDPVAYREYFSDSEYGLWTWEACDDGYGYQCLKIGDTGSWLHCSPWSGYKTHVRAIEGKLSH
jgi:hypothetical protein